MMRILRTFLMTCVLGTIVLSCEKNKDPFYQVDAFETELHKNVNKFRRSQGLSELVFFHDLFIEAREQSLDWKNTGNPTQGLDERMQTIEEHWNPTRLALINGGSISKDTTAARLVVESWIQDSMSRTILIDDFVQSGPGIAVGDNGEVYINHFFMKIPD